MEFDFNHFAIVCIVFIFKRLLGVAHIFLSVLLDFGVCKQYYYYWNIMSGYGGQRISMHKLVREKNNSMNVQHHLPYASLMQTVKCSY